MLTTREVHLGTSSAFFFADDASQHHYENIDVDSFGRCASELIIMTILCCECSINPSVRSFPFRRLTLKHLPTDLPFLCPFRCHLIHRCPSLSALAALSTTLLDWNRFQSALHCQSVSRCSSIESTMQQTEAITIAADSGLGGCSCCGCHVWPEPSSYHPHSSLANGHSVMISIINNEGSTWE